MILTPLSLVIKQMEVTLPTAGINMDLAAVEQQKQPPNHQTGDPPSRFVDVIIFTGDPRVNFSLTPRLSLIGTLTMKQFWVSHNKCALNDPFKFTLIFLTEKTTTKTTVKNNSQKQQNKQSNVVLLSESQTIGRQ